MRFCAPGIEGRDSKLGKALSTAVVRAGVAAVDSRVGVRVNIVHVFHELNKLLLYLEVLDGHLLAGQRCLLSS